MSRLVRLLAVLGFGSEKSRVLRMVHAHVLRLS